MLIHDQIIVLFIIIFLSCTYQYEISVIHDTKADKYSIVNGSVHNAVSVAVFNNNISKTG